MRARLFDQRVVLISGELDEEVAGQAAAELMTLDANGDAAVQVRLDSAEGSVSAAMTLMDVVELLGVPVHVTALGQVAGPGVGVLATADQREATPHTRLVLREPRRATTGDAGELARWAAEQQSQWRSFCARVAEAAGRATEQVVADMAAGRSLSADEAVAYGLLDRVRRPAAVSPLPGRPGGAMGFAPGGAEGQPRRPSDGRG